MNIAIASAIGAAWPRTGAYFSLAPFAGAALAIIGWRERPAVFFAVAVACMALGVWLHFE